MLLLLLTLLKLLFYLVFLWLPCCILFLGFLTWIHQKMIRLFVLGREDAVVVSKPANKTNNNNNNNNSMHATTSSAIYCGRVSHTRFVPITHGFSYPLFFCLLDLSEVPLLFYGKYPLLWPLNYIFQFREEDHLKNGEGIALSPSPPYAAALLERPTRNSTATKSNKSDVIDTGTTFAAKNSEKEKDVSKFSISPTQDEQKHDDGCLLMPRIRQLVQERTGGKFVPSHDQKILLLTHLSYFGYCFNPVSFYYILKKECHRENKHEKNGNNDIHHDTMMDKPNRIEAIVAEVSNTPWNEMKCYVLHPDSQDMIQVKDGRCRKMRNHDMTQEGKQNHTSYWHSVNYLFQKKFHVSPFMDMEHLYDWTFWDLTHDRIMVSTTMKKKKKTTTTMKQYEPEEKRKGQEEEKEQEETTVTYFNAFFDIQRTSFHPMRICYQMIRFPMYCMIIQFWIHVQALKLFVKGVEFIPHPQGSETVASRLIGYAMAPFFQFKDWWSSRNTTTTSSGSSSTSSNPENIQKIKDGIDTTKCRNREKVE